MGIKVKRMGPECVWFYRIRQWLRNRKARKVFKAFGEGSELRLGTYIIYPGHISIGKNVAIRPGSMLFADKDAFIQIHGNVLLGPGVKIFVNNHRTELNIPVVEQGYEPSEDVIIKDGAWIGADVIILPGVVIGNNAVVGAGSVVTKNVPKNQVWGGSPARRLKQKQIVGMLKGKTDVEREEVPLYYSRKRRESRDQGQEHKNIQSEATNTLGLRCRRR